MTYIFLSGFLAVDVNHAIEELSGVIYHKGKREHYCTDIQEVRYSRNKKT